MLDDLVAIGRRVHRDDVDSWRHHLRHRGVGEGEDAEQHVPLGGAGRVRVIRVGHALRVCASAQAASRSDAAGTAQASPRRRGVPAPSAPARRGEQPGQQIADDPHQSHRERQAG